MRIGPPPTPAQIRAEFDDALQNLAMKGILPPSCVPFNDEVTRALEKIAMARPHATPTQIAAARAALNRQLAQRTP